MSKTSIDRLAIVGVGLIGGSFALALKQQGAVRRVIGVGRSAANLARAKQLGAVDEIAADLPAAVREADLVLVAVPVAQTETVLRAMAPHLRPQTVVTDAGSVKQSVIEQARACLGAKIGQFVPAHPIAGAEQSGVEAARADLFLNKKVVITALPENAPAALERVRAAWTWCGAQVREMDPASHDAVFAAVSHLPHLLAYALVHDIALHDNASVLFDHAAGGFRDFTRIASSHPEMWRDICIANRKALLGELARYQDELTALKAMLERADGAALQALFEKARAARNKWLKQ